MAAATPPVPRLVPSSHSSDQALIHPPRGANSPTDRQSPTDAQSLVDAKPQSKVSSFVQTPRGKEESSRRETPSIPVSKVLESQSFPPVPPYSGPHSVVGNITHPTRNGEVKGGGDQRSRGSEDALLLPHTIRQRLKLWGGCEVAAVTRQCHGVDTTWCHRHCGPERAHQKFQEYSADRQRSSTPLSSDLRDPILLAQQSPRPRSVDAAISSTATSVHSSSQRDADDHDIHDNSVGFQSSSTDSNWPSHSDNSPTSPIPEPIDEFSSHTDCYHLVAAITDQPYHLSEGCSSSLPSVCSPTPILSRSPLSSVGPGQRDPSSDCQQCPSCDKLSKCRYDQPHMVSDSPSCHHCHESDRHIIQSSRASRRQVHDQRFSRIVYIFSFAPKHFASSIVEQQQQLYSNYDYLLASRLTELSETPAASPTTYSTFSLFSTAGSPPSPSKVNLILPSPSPFPSSPTSRSLIGIQSPAPSHYNLPFRRAKQRVMSHARSGFATGCFCGRFPCGIPAGHCLSSASVATELGAALATSSSQPYLFHDGTTMANRNTCGIHHLPYCTVEQSQMPQHCNRTKSEHHNAYWHHENHKSLPFTRGWSPPFPSLAGTEGSFRFVCALFHDTPAIAAKWKEASVTTGTCLVVLCQDISLNIWRESEVHQSQGYVFFDLALRVSLLLSLPYSGSLLQCVDWEWLANYESPPPHHQAGAPNCVGGLDPCHSNGHQGADRHFLFVFSRATPPTGHCSRRHHSLDHESGLARPSPSPLFHVYFIQGLNRGANVRPTARRILGEEHVSFPFYFSSLLSARPTTSGGSGCDISYPFHLSHLQVRPLVRRSVFPATRTTASESRSAPLRSKTLTTRAEVYPGRLVSALSGCLPAPLNHVLDEEDSPVSENSFGDDPYCSARDEGEYERACIDQHGHRHGSPYMTPVETSLGSCHVALRGTSLGVTLFDTLPPVQLELLSSCGDRLTVVVEPFELLVDAFGEVIGEDSVELPRSFWLRYGVQCVDTGPSDLPRSPTCFYSPSSLSSTPTRLTNLLPEFPHRAAIPSPCQAALTGLWLACNKSMRNLSSFCPGLGLAVGLDSVILSNSTPSSCVFDSISCLASLTSGSSSVTNLEDRDVRANQMGETMDVADDHCASTCSPQEKSSKQYSSPACRVRSVQFNEKHDVAIVLHASPNKLNSIWKITTLCAGGAPLFTLQALHLKSVLPRNWQQPPRSSCNVSLNNREKLDSISGEDGAGAVHRAAPSCCSIFLWLDHSSSTAFDVVDKFLAEILHYNTLPSFEGGFWVPSSSSISSFPAFMGIVDGGRAIAALQIDTLRLSSGVSLLPFSGMVHQALLPPAFANKTSYDAENLKRRKRSRHCCWHDLMDEISEVLRCWTDSCTSRQANAVSPQSRENCREVAGSPDSVGEDSPSTSSDAYGPRFLYSFVHIECLSPHIDPAETSWNRSDKEIRADPLGTPEWYFLAVIECRSPTTSSRFPSEVSASYLPCVAKTTVERSLQSDEELGCKFCSSPYAGGVMHIILLFAVSDHHDESGQRILRLRLCSAWPEERCCHHPSVKTAQLPLAPRIGHFSMASSSTIPHYGQSISVEAVSQPVDPHPPPLSGCIVAGDKATIATSISVDWRFDLCKVEDKLVWISQNPPTSTAKRLSESISRSLSSSTSPISHAPNSEFPSMYLCGRHSCKLYSLKLPLRKSCRSSGHGRSHTLPLPRLFPLADALHPMMADDLRSETNSACAITQMKQGWRPISSVPGSLKSATCPATPEECEGEVTGSNGLQCTTSMMGPPSVRSCSVSVGHLAVSWSDGSSSIFNLADVSPNPFLFVLSNASEGGGEVRRDRHKKSVSSPPRHSLHLPSFQQLWVWPLMPCHHLESNRLSDEREECNEGRVGGSDFENMIRISPDISQSSGPTCRLAGPRVCPAISFGSDGVSFQKLSDGGTGLMVKQSDCCRIFTRTGKLIEAAKKSCLISLPPLFVGEEWVEVMRVPVINHFDPCSGSGGSGDNQVENVWWRGDGCLICLSASSVSDLLAGESFENWTDTSSYSRRAAKLSEGRFKDGKPAPSLLQLPDKGFIEIYDSCLPVDWIKLPPYYYPLSHVFFGLSLPCLPLSPSSPPSCSYPATRAAHIPSPTFPPLCMHERNISGAGDKANMHAKMLHQASRINIGEGSRSTLPPSRLLGSVIPQYPSILGDHRLNTMDSRIDQSLRTLVSSSTKTASLASGHTVQDKTHIVTSIGRPTIPLSEDSGEMEGQVKSLEMGVSPKSTTSSLQQRPFYHPETLFDLLCNGHLILVTRLLQALSFYLHLLFSKSKEQSEDFTHTAISNYPFAVQDAECGCVAYVRQLPDAIVFSYLATSVGWYMKAVEKCRVASHANLSRELWSILHLNATSDASLKHLLYENLDLYKRDGKKMRAFKYSDNVAQTGAGSSTHNPPTPAISSSHQSAGPSLANALFGDDEANDFDLGEDFLGIGRKKAGGFSLYNDDSGSGGGGLIFDDFSSRNDEDLNTCKISQTADPDLCSEVTATRIARDADSFGTVGDREKVEGQAETKVEREGTGGETRDSVESKQETVTLQRMKIALREVVDLSMARSLPFACTWARYGNGGLSSSSPSQSCPTAAGQETKTEKIYEGGGFFPEFKVDFEMLLHLLGSGLGGGALSLGRSQKDERPDHIVGNSSQSSGSIDLVERDDWKRTDSVTEHEGETNEAADTGRALIVLPGLNVEEQVQLLTFIKVCRFSVDKEEEERSVHQKRQCAWMNLILHDEEESGRQWRDEEGPEGSLSSEQKIEVGSNRNELEKLDIMFDAMEDCFREKSRESVNRFCLSMVRRRIVVECLGGEQMLSTEGIKDGKANPKGTVGARQSHQYDNREVGGNPTDALHSLNRKSLPPPSSVTPSQPHAILALLKLQPLSSEDICWAVIHPSSSLLYQNYVKPYVEAISQSATPSLSAPFEASPLAPSPSDIRAGRLTWNILRDCGVGFWLVCPGTIRSLGLQLQRDVIVGQSIEQMDIEQFAMWAIANGKLGLLRGLYKAKNDLKVLEFLSNDFRMERWALAAVKNAFALVRQKRYHLAIAFCLLVRALDDVVEICCKHLDDFQLGIMLCRLVHVIDSTAASSSSKTSKFGESGELYGDLMPLTPAARIRQEGKLMACTKTTNKAADDNIVFIFGDFSGGDDDDIFHLTSLDTVKQQAGVSPASSTLQFVEARTQAPATSPRVSPGGGRGDEERSVELPLGLEACQRAYSRLLWLRLLPLARKTGDRWLSALTFLLAGDESRAVTCLVGPTMRGFLSAPPWRSQTAGDSIEREKNGGEGSQSVESGQMKEYHVNDSAHLGGLAPTGDERAMPKEQYLDIKSQSGTAAFPFILLAPEVKLRCSIAPVIAAIAQASSRQRHTALVLEQEKEGTVLPVFSTRGGSVESSMLFNCGALRYTSGVSSLSLPYFRSLLIYRFTSRRVLDALSQYKKRRIQPSAMGVCKESISADLPPIVSLLRSPSVAAEIRRHPTLSSAISEVNNEAFPNRGPPSAGYESPASKEHLLMVIAFVESVSQQIVLFDAQDAQSLSAIAVAIQDPLLSLMASINLSTLISSASTSTLPALPLTYCRVQCDQTVKPDESSQQEAVSCEGIEANGDELFNWSKRLVNGVEACQALSAIKKTNYLVSMIKRSIRQMTLDPASLVSERSLFFGLFAMELSCHSLMMLAERGAPTVAMGVDAFVCSVINGASLPHFFDSDGNRASQFELFSENVDDSERPCRFGIRSDDGATSANFASCFVSDTKEVAKILSALAFWQSRTLIQQNFFPHARRKPNLQWYYPDNDHTDYSKVLKHVEQKKVTSQSVSLHASSGVVRCFFDAGPKASGLDSCHVMLPHWSIKAFFESIFSYSFPDQLEVTLRRVLTQQCSATRLTATAAEVFSTFAEAFRYLECKIGREMVIDSSSATSSKSKSFQDPQSVGEAVKEAVSSLISSRSSFIWPSWSRSSLAHRNCVCDLQVAAIVAAAEACEEFVDSNSARRTCVIGMSDPSFTQQQQSHTRATGYAESHPLTALPEHSRSTGSLESPCLRCRNAVEWLTRFLSTRLAATIAVQANGFIYPSVVAWKGLLMKFLSHRGQEVQKDSLLPRTVPARSAPGSSPIDGQHKDHSQPTSHPHISSPSDHDISWLSELHWHYKISPPFLDKAVFHALWRVTKRHASPSHYLGSAVSLDQEQHFSRLSPTIKPKELPLRTFSSNSFNTAEAFSESSLEELDCALSSAFRSFSLPPIFHFIEGQEKMDSKAGEAVLERGMEEIARYETNEIPENLGERHQFETLSETNSDQKPPESCSVLVSLVKDLLDCSAGRLSETIAGRDGSEVKSFYGRTNSCKSDLLLFGNGRRRDLYIPAIYVHLMRLVSAPMRSTKGVHLGVPRIILSTPPASRLSTSSLRRVSSSISPFSTPSRTPSSSNLSPRMNRSTDSPSPPSDILTTDCDKTAYYGHLSALEANISIFHPKTIFHASAEPDCRQNNDLMSHEAARAFHLLENATATVAAVSSVLLALSYIFPRLNLFGHERGRVDSWQDAERSARDHRCMSLLGGKGLGCLGVKCKKSVAEKSVSSTTSLPPTKQKHAKSGLTASTLRALIFCHGTKSIFRRKVDTRWNESCQLKSVGSATDACKGAKKKGSSKMVDEKLSRRGDDAGDREMCRAETSIQLKRMAFWTMNHLAGLVHVLRVLDSLFSTPPLPIRLRLNLENGESSPSKVALLLSHSSREPAFSPDLTSGPWDTTVVPREPPVSVCDAVNDHVNLAMQKIALESQAREDLCRVLLRFFLSPLAYDEYTKMVCSIAKSSQHDIDYRPSSPSKIGESIAAERRCSSSHLRDPGSGRTRSRSHSYDEQAVKGLYSRRKAQGVKIERPSSISSSEMCRQSRAIPDSGDEISTVDTPLPDGVVLLMQASMTSFFLEFCVSKLDLALHRIQTALLRATVRSSPALGKTIDIYRYSESLSSMASWLAQLKRSFVTYLAGRINPLVRQLASIFACCILPWILLDGGHGGGRVSEAILSSPATIMQQLQAIRNTQSFSKERCRHKKYCANAAEVAEASSEGRRDSPENDLSMTRRAAESSEQRNVDSQSRNTSSTRVEAVTGTSNRGHSSTSPIPSPASSESQKHSVDSNCHREAASSAFELARILSHAEGKQHGPGELNGADETAQGSFDLFVMQTCGLDFSVAWTMLNGTQRLRQIYTSCQDFRWSRTAHFSERSDSLSPYSSSMNSPCLSCLLPTAAAATQWLSKGSSCTALSLPLPAVTIGIFKDIKCLAINRCSIGVIDPITSLAIVPSGHCFLGLGPNQPLSFPLLVSSLDSTTAAKNHGTCKSTVDDASGSSSDSLVPAKMSSWLAVNITWEALARLSVSQMVQNQELSSIAPSTLGMRCKKLIRPPVFNRSLHHASLPTDLLLEFARGQHSSVSLNGHGGTRWLNKSSGDLTISVRKTADVEDEETGRGRGVSGTSDPYVGGGGCNHRMESLVMPHALIGMSSKRGSQLRFFDGSISTIPFFPDAEFPRKAGEVDVASTLSLQGEKEEALMDQQANFILSHFPQLSQASCASSLEVMQTIWTEIGRRVVPLLQDMWGKNPSPVGSAKIWYRQKEGGDSVVSDEVYCETLCQGPATDDLACLEALNLTSSMDLLQRSKSWAVLKMIQRGLCAELDHRLIASLIDPSSSQFDSAVRMISLTLQNQVAALQSSQTSPLLLGPSCKNDLVIPFSSEGTKVENLLADQCACVAAERYSAIISSFDLSRCSSPPSLEAPLQFLCPSSPLPIPLSSFCSPYWPSSISNTLERPQEVSHRVDSHHENSFRKFHLQHQSPPSSGPSASFNIPEINECDGVAPEVMPNYASVHTDLKLPVSTAQLSRLALQSLSREVSLLVLSKIRLLCAPAKDLALPLRSTNPRHSISACEVYRPDYLVGGVASALLQPLTAYQPHMTFTGSLEAHPFLPIYAAVMQKNDIKTNAANAFAVVLQIYEEDKARLMEMEAYQRRLSDLFSNHHKQRGYKSVPLGTHSREMKQGEARSVTATTAAARYPARVPVSGSPPMSSSISFTSCASVSPPPLIDPLRSEGHQEAFGAKSPNTRVSESAYLTQQQRQPVYIPRANAQKFGQIEDMKWSSRGTSLAVADSNGWVRCFVLGREVLLSRPTDASAPGLALPYVSFRAHVSANQVEFLDGDGCWLVTMGKGLHRHSLRGCSVFIGGRKEVEREMVTNSSAADGGECGVTGDSGRVRDVSIWSASEEDEDYEKRGAFADSPLTNSAFGRSSRHNEVHHLLPSLDRSGGNLSTDSGVYNQYTQSSVSKAKGSDKSDSYHYSSLRHSGREAPSLAKSKTRSSLSRLRTDIHGLLSNLHRALNRRSSTLRRQGNHHDPLKSCGHSGATVMVKDDSRWSSANSGRAASLEFSELYHNSPFMSSSFSAKTFDADRKIASPFRSCLVPPCSSATAPQRRSLVRVKRQPAQQSPRFHGRRKGNKERQNGPPYSEHDVASSASSPPDPTSAAPAWYAPFFGAAMGSSAWSTEDTHQNGMTAVANAMKSAGVRILEGGCVFVPTGIEESGINVQVSGECICVWDLCDTTLGGGPRLECVITCDDNLKCSVRTGSMVTDAAEKQQVGFWSAVGAMSATSSTFSSADATASSMRGYLANSSTFSPTVFIPGEDYSVASKQPRTSLDPAPPTRSVGHSNPILGGPSDADSGEVATSQGRQMEPLVMKVTASHKPTCFCTTYSWKSGFVVTDSESYREVDPWKGTHVVEGVEDGSRGNDSSVWPMKTHLLAYGDSGGEVHIVDLGARSEEMRWSAHSRPVVKCYFVKTAETPETLLTIAEDSTVRLWKIFPDGHCNPILLHEAIASAASYTSDSAPLSPAASPEDRTPICSHIDASKDKLTDFDNKKDAQLLRCENDVDNYRHMREPSQNGDEESPSGRISLTSTSIRSPNDVSDDSVRDGSYSHSPDAKEAMDRKSETALALRGDGLESGESRGIVLVAQLSRGSRPLLPLPRPKPPAIVRGLEGRTARLIGFSAESRLAELGSHLFAVEEAAAEKMRLPVRRCPLPSPMENDKALTSAIDTSPSRTCRNSKPQEGKTLSGPSHSSMSFDLSTDRTALTPAVHKPVTSVVACATNAMSSASLNSTTGSLNSISMVPKLTRSSYYQTMSPPTTPFAFNMGNSRLLPNDSASTNRNMSTSLGCLFGAVSHGEKANSSHMERMAATTASPVVDAKLVSESHILLTHEDGRLALIRFS